MRCFMSAHLLKSLLRTSLKPPINQRVAFKMFSSEVKENMKSILKLEHYVKPSGTLKVTLPYPVQLVTFDPEKYPAMDKIIVNVFHSNHDELSDNDIQQLCRIDNQGEFIVLNCNENIESESGLSCRIDVPIKYNLEVSTQHHSDVCLESIECNHCVVSTQNGSIICSRMKTENLRAKTTGGHILCSGTVLGDIYLDTQEMGSIQAEKLQGNTLMMRTENGSVNVKSIYAVKTQIMNQNGNLNLFNVHGSTDVIMKDGSLNMQGVDGSLNVKAENAEVSINVSLLNNLSVETDKGDINISLPENVSSKIHLEGNKVHICDELNFTGETGPLLQQWTGKIGQSEVLKSRVYASTKNGCISVRQQDWLSSLDLHLTNPDKKNYQE